MKRSRNKIALVGAHGVGKTTLSRHLAAQLRTRRFSVSIVSELPRLICRKTNDPGFFRREKNSILKQALLLFGQIEQEELVSHRKSDFLLCDRSVLDHWIYTRYLFGNMLREEGVLDIYEFFVSEYSRTYNQLFYLPIESIPRDDGTRESDLIFQSAIDKKIVKFMRDKKLSFVQVTGSLKERLDTVMNELDLSSGRRHSQRASETQAEAR